MGRIKDWIKNWNDELSDEIRHYKGVQGFKVERSISARVGQHYCPYCHGGLQVKKKIQIVNSETEEAKNFDFSTSEGRLRGNIKFHWDVFYCGKCDIELPVGDILCYERELKKTGAHVSFNAFRTDYHSPEKEEGRRKRNSRMMLLFIAGVIIITILLACLGPGKGRPSESSKEPEPPFDITIQLEAG